MTVSNFHNLLRRQIKRHMPDLIALPDECHSFLQAVNDAYHQFDDDRNMLERSLELSSQELLEANSELRAIFQAMPDLLLRLDEHGIILDFKGGRAEDFFNVPKQIIGKSVFAVPDFEVSQKFRDAIAKVLDTKSIASIEYSLTRRGQTNHYEARLLPLPNNQIVAIIQNINTHKQAEWEKSAQLERVKRQQAAIVQLATSESLGSGELQEAFRTITETTADALHIDRVGIWLFNPERSEICCHDLFYRADRSHREGIVQQVADFPRYFETLVKSRVIDATDCRNDPRTDEFTDHYYIPFGITSLLDATIRIRGDVVGVICHEHIGEPRRFWQDEVAFTGQVADQVAQAMLAAERKKAKEERSRLQEQLYQSQKMEAIGRLAGGVAHDFNNILTAIRGFSDLLLYKLDDSNPLRKDVNQIVYAADTAASLTAQLLAFSRKQVISPKVLNLNEVIAGSQKMLQRIIGENIHFTYEPGNDLWFTKADPGQLNQALINLVVNARQAMEDVGRLSLSSHNVTVGEQRCQSCSSVFNGDFVVVEVSDTGSGMSDETVQMIFEPFFTSKPIEKGTGLGLATVHGIVHQCGGHIEVVSQLGVGTTFRLFFPKMEQPAVEPEKKENGKSPTGNETILLVEDQDIVRRLTKRLLTMHGYHVLEASDGPEALYICNGYPEKIHLLLTDVIMPKMNGHDLSVHLKKILPDLDVIFMSGYTEDTIGVHGVLEEGINFLQKPFQGEDLARKVRDVLDHRSS
ncbi:MAG TPA: response regulator [bacterium]|nr:response regulator [bacterium]